MVEMMMCMTHGWIDEIVVMPLEYPKRDSFSTDHEDTCRVLNTAFLQFSNLESIYFKFVDSHILTVYESLRTNY